jgi:hypothetical protein
LFHVLMLRTGYLITSCNWLFNDYLLIFPFYVLISYFISNIFICE